MQPIESRREHARSPVPMASKGKVAPVIQKLYREPSPTGKSTLGNRPSHASPSPMRRPDPTKSEEANLLKEVQYYKAQERKLVEAIQALKQEVLQMTRRTFKQESEIKLKSAKLENEKNEIVDYFVECVGRKLVVLNLGPDRSRSLSGEPVRRPGEMSYRSNSFQIDLQKNEMEVTRANRALKAKARQGMEGVPASVRALARNYNLTD